MNKIIIFLLMIFLATSLFSQSAVDLFKKGNEAYKKGDYKTAIESYEKIISLGYESGDILFNLGNAYYRTGQFANAILNYERAKKYDTNDKEIEHNLAIANLRIKDRLEKVPRLFIFEWWENIKNIFSLHIYQYFIFILFTIFVISFALFFWVKDVILKKRILFVSIFLGLVFAFFAIAFISKAVEHDNDKYAILFEQSLKVKSAPDQNALDLFEIHYGIKFKIVDELEDWCKILLIDGKTGWIKKDGFEII